MKKNLLLLALLLSSTLTFAQVISIDSARTLGVGAVVTVRGIATNGSELGNVRYMQDNTAGIAAYGSTLSTVSRGDSIEITGTVKSYSELLEIDPITNLTIINSGNTLPNPLLITPAQIDETKESQLVQINDAIFTTSPGGTFSSNTAYNFTANGETSTIYVNSSSQLIGQTVPSGPANLIGLASQHSYSGPTTGYQLVCRDANDIVITSSIWLTNALTESNISTTGFDLSWETNIAGTTELIYGSSMNNLNQSLSATGTVTNHTLSLSGLSASEIVYAKAYSVNGSDTAFSPIRTYVTKSTSTGNIIAYFNHATDHSVSSGVNAITLPSAIDDTLIAYIDRATESVDFTMYNFNEADLSSVSGALNSAHNRGVTVRIIFDGSANNSGIQNVIPAIKKIASFQGSEYGIMHNKFIIIDAHSTDPNVPLVWTGGTNLTKGQVNTDPNTVIIIQDKSLALAYTLEFNEMFGSTTAIPDMNAAKFGPHKMDNTPHNFIIDGKNVQCFFSPSDGTNSQILNTIDNADNNMSIATMLITRSDISYALKDAVDNRNVDLKILVNSEGQCSQTVWALLSSLLGDSLQEDAAVAGIMHHKFMIVDEGTTSSPTLLVGSHNWSNSANNKNDENTLIFHDNQTLANIYYQAFRKRFDQNLYVGFMETGFAKKVSVYPNPSNGNINLDIDATENMNLDIKIYDLSGRVVWSSQKSIMAGSNNIRINANDLASGSYVIQVLSNGKTFVNTLIID